MLFLKLALLVFYIHTTIVSIRYSNSPIQFQIPATVPGGIYTDLQNAGILTSDLYYRFNEDNFKWVALTNWTYMATFNLSKNNDILSKESIFLNCEGNY